MKKPSLLISLISCFISLSAQERLAVFAIEKDTSAKLPCISIDFFRSIPNGDLYGSIGDHFTPKYKATGHTRFDGKAKIDLSVIDSIGYFGVENVVVLPHYRKFLAAVTGACKGQLPNDDSLDSLQLAVWCYNVLDELGFIDRKVADQQDAFQKATKQFAFRYGLTGALQDTNSTVQPQAIISKASQVYFNRENSTKATEKPDSLRFTDTTIVYRQGVQAHAIAAHYHNIPTKELEPFAAALKDGIYIYLRDYRIDPGQVDVIKWSAGPASYILTFSAVNGSPRWVMRVRVGE
ncbi:hypothetical protein A3860_36460 [Niastella vici]|uniref:Thioester domain-containing protein n=1 Tax=Niastella vici TaxID=1703345 RepID=A0A1V9FMT8_9BACT|nr:hypothetical protein [Niastella vici]OQP59665.1 hypothetical protein A3860_36460 [Niastella vici]